MTKEELSIQEKADKILELLRELEKEASEKKIGFDFNIAYGMGGWFDEDTYENDGVYRWQPSSGSC